MIKAAKIFFFAALIIYASDVRGASRILFRAPALNTVKTMEFPPFGAFTSASYSGCGGACLIRRRVSS